MFKMIQAENDTKDVENWYVLFLEYISSVVEGQNQQVATTAFETLSWQQHTFGEVEQ